MRVLTSILVLGLCTACVQKTPAPVEYKGGRVFAKDAQYSKSGFELPKYSADNPATLPASQEERYAVPAEKSQYDIPAEYDAISTKELTPPNEDYITDNPYGDSVLDVPRDLDSPVDLSTPDALDTPKEYSAPSFDEDLNGLDEVEVPPLQSPPSQEKPLVELEPEPELELEPEIVEDNEADIINPRSSSFVWPVRGKILQSYTPESRGINIEARKGTPIRAVNEGVVQYAGDKIKGYGNLLIVAHNNGYYSAYAHADDIVVAKGASVVQGQLIGFVGQTGAVDKPQLYFSLRNGTGDSASVNPIPLLSND